MKLDKKMLDSLLTLPDDKLIGMIRLISGGEIFARDPDPKRVSGIRYMFSQVTDNDLERVSELLTLYKKGKRQ